VQDTVEFEKRGIPATFVLTSAFQYAAIYSFKTKGLEAHPFIELPHPISNLTNDEMRALTLKYTDELVKQLTG